MDGRERMEKSLFDGNKEEVEEEGVGAGMTKREE